MLVLVAVVSIGIMRSFGKDTIYSTYDNINESMIVAGDPGGCWVASELFGGWYEPKTVAARYYVNNMAPLWFKDLYLAHGEKFAQTLHKHPMLKPLVRPLFEHFAEQGAKLIEKTS